MTLQQLRYFLAAAEHGSFTAAARSVYVAQPSLSEQVRQLVAELGGGEEVAELLESHRLFLSIMK